MIPMIRKAAAFLVACDWSQARLGAAFLRIPAILIALLLGLFFHDASAGIISVSGAFSVGMVGTRKVGQSSFRAMLLTIACMGTGACLGTITGDVPLLSIIVTSLLSAAFALSIIHDEDLGWVCMQGVIALLVSTSFPGDLRAGLIRSGLVIGGGLLQIMLIYGGSWVINFVSMKAVFQTASTQAAPVQQPHLKLTWKIIQENWAYPLRVLITTVVAVELGKHLGIRNGYWLPMTMIIILKPDFYRTYSGGFQRVIGTFIGVMFASIIAHLFQPSTGWLIGLVSLFSISSFAWAKVNPILFSSCLTAYVVFLIALSGLPEASVTWARLELTAAGSSLAIVSRMIGFRTLRSSAPLNPSSAVSAASIK